MPCLWSKLHNSLNLYPISKFIWGKCAFWDPIILWFKGQTSIHSLRTLFVQRTKLPKWVKTLPWPLVFTLAIFSSSIILIPLFFHFSSLSQRFFAPSLDQNARWNQKLCCHEHRTSKWPNMLQSAWPIAQPNFKSRPQLHKHVTFTSNSSWFDYFCILFYSMKWSFASKKITKYTSELELA